MAKCGTVGILIISSVMVLFGNCANEEDTLAYEDYIDGRHCLAVPVERKVTKPGYVLMQGEVVIDGMEMHYYCAKKGSKKREEL